MFNLLRIKMGGEEESKWMLPLEQMETASKPGTDEASCVLGSLPAGPPFANDDHEIEEVRVPPYALSHVTGTISAMTLWIWGLPMLGCAAWILSRGTTTKITSHALLSNCITYIICLRTMKPGSPPLFFYFAALVVSVLSGLAAVCDGLAVLVLTRDYYDKRDERRTETCRTSKYNNPKKRHPRTLEGNVYNVLIVCFCFAAIAL
ncbi:hypothetical protein C7999DRAFT_30102 [Corynascus novoguineensis]|uniref:Uncharacterized protein n=1 Tax=Corynascus novoguineensis TaxID=1126955 RepID=A0AAN7CW31_9PEZI|nr:hypothetical protein C7999DRAFT_30102 [Corynascus novoguineensis]